MSISYREQCLIECKGIGYATSIILANTAAGAAVGLMQGNPALAGTLAVGGFALGVVQVAVMPSNASQIATGVVAGGVIGGAMRSGTSLSGRIAGGVVGGLFSAAGAPNSVSGFAGGLVSGLGDPGNALPAIGRNLIKGGLQGLAAGLVGDLVNEAGQSITDKVCEKICSH